MLHRRIELDAFQPHLDEIRFRNRAFLKPRQIESNELFEGLAVFCGDLDAASRQHRLKIETLHFCHALANGVGKPRLGN